MSDNKSLTSPQSQEKVDNWFSTFIDHLRVDHLLLQTNTASKEKQAFYNAMIDGDSDKLMSNVRNTSSKYFIKKIIADYLNELEQKNVKPEKLALGLTDSKILVWSEIRDDDYETEDVLLLAEANTNNKYHDYGFYISSTIIEKSDNLPVPPHYQTILE